jgi:WD40 repeat protein
MTLIRSFVGHSNTVNDVAFINDEWLMSASDDATVRVWRVSDGTQVRRVTLFSPVYSLDVTDDGQLAIVGLDNGTVQFLNIPPYTVSELLEWVNSNRHLVEFSCDERRVYHLDIENMDCS